jgi:Zn-finger nucleic acid-binding protein
MQCPVDGTTLAISDKQGIEIDYCPQCRGVWLDRGELEKLLDRMGSQHHARHDERPRESYDRERHGGHKKKREGFLGDLFDF